MIVSIFSCGISVSLPPQTFTVKTFRYISNVIIYTKSFLQNNDGRKRTLPFRESNII